MISFDYLRTKQGIRNTFDMTQGILDYQTKACLYVVHPEYISTIDFLEQGENFNNMYVYLHLFVSVMYIFVTVVFLICILNQKSIRHAN